MRLEMEKRDKSHREVQETRDVEAAEGWDWQDDLNGESSEDGDLLLSFGARDCRRDDSRETALKDAIVDFFPLSLNCNENGHQRITRVLANIQVQTSSFPCEKEKFALHHNWI